MKDKPVYQQLRTAGLVLYIPFLLAIGPLSGYFLGSFLKTRYAWPEWSVYVFIFLGFLSSMFETARIIKIVMRSEKDIK